MLEVKQLRAAGAARSDPAAGLTIAEAARRTGVSAHTFARRQTEHELQRRPLSTPQARQSARHLAA